MKPKRTNEVSIRLIYFLSLPLIILFLMPGGALLGGMWFWMLLLVCLWMQWMMVGVPVGTPPAVIAHICIERREVHGYLTLFSSSLAMPVNFALKL